MSGWIRVDRKITEHWLWTDGEKLKWWLDLLFMATWEGKKVLCQSQVVELKKGQLITSLNTLSKRWRVNKRTVMRFLDMVKNEDMIVHQSVHQHISIITICNYERYQNIETNQCTNQCTDEYTNQCTNQCTNHLNKQINKETNNIEIEKETSLKGGKEKEKESATVVATPAKGGVDEKIKAFYDELIPYVSVYGKEMVRDFFEYWTEKNESGTQFRKQREKTWNTSRRLRMWAKQENKFGKYGCNTSNQSTPQQRANDVAELIARLGAKNKPFEG